MVSGDITKNGMSNSNVDPCGVCCLKIVLCLQCGKWFHGRCAGVKRVTPKFSGSFTCIKCKGNTGEAVELEEKLCD